MLMSVPLMVQLYSGDLTASVVSIHIELVVTIFLLIDTGSKGRTTLNITKTDIMSV